MKFLVTNRREFFETLGWTQFASVEDSLADLEQEEYIANDTETTGLGFKFSDLHCIQLGTQHNQYVIDVQLPENGGSANPVDLQLYKKLLEKKTSIFHNGLFDLVFYMDLGS